MPRVKSYFENWIMVSAIDWIDDSRFKGKILLPKVLGNRAVKGAWYLLAWILTT